MQVRTCGFVNSAALAVGVVLGLGMAAGVWAADEDAGGEQAEAPAIRWSWGSISMDSMVAIDADGRPLEERARRTLAMDLTWDEGARITGISALILERVELPDGEAVDVAELAKNQRRLARRIGSMSLNRSRSRVHTPLPELPRGTSRIEALEGYVEATVGVGEPERVVLTVDDAKAGREVTVDGATPLKIETDFDPAGNQVYLRYPHREDIRFGDVRVVDADGNDVRAGGGASWGSADSIMERRIGVGDDGKLGVRVEIEVYREVKVIRVPLILRGLMLPGHVKFAA